MDTENVELHLIRREGNKPSGSGDDDGNVPLIAYQRKKNRRSEAAPSGAPGELHANVPARTDQRRPVPPKVMRLESSGNDQDLRDPMPESLVSQDVCGGATGSQIIEGSAPLKISHPSPPRRKLLVLDVNGVLAEFGSYLPRGHKADMVHRADMVISNKPVYKRPFSDEFLEFCFDHFDVGIWSSRASHNLKLAVDFLVGTSQDRLLFCWDQSHCTDTRFTVLGTHSRPLFLKELSKLWEKLNQYRPGYYDASNTLLLDDTPYKALHNPPYTAIFPHPYRYDDNDDNSLGHGGSLQLYLEGLTMVDDVQAYVEQNPFGQSAITETSPDWDFCRQV